VLGIKREPLKKLEIECLWIATIEKIKEDFKLQKLVRKSSRGFLAVFACGSQKQYKKLPRCRIEIQTFSEA
jgi:hypothetical protein